MSGVSRLINSKLTSEGKESEVTKALSSADANTKAASIKEICAKSSKGYGKKSK